uniref:Uncharacterized protein n=1 Tax=Timema cristinae TaxID=61476 RepID=A0A7R9CLA7_TIMCR|nr:unnamed protein product [Timema cristinae]
MSESHLDSSLNPPSSIHGEQFVVLIPLRNMKATTTVNALCRRVWALFGAPRVVEGEGVESPVGRAEQQQVGDCEEGLLKRSSGEIKPRPPEKKTPRELKIGKSTRTM